MCHVYVYYVETRNRNVSMRGDVIHDLNERISSSTLLVSSNGKKVLASKTRPLDNAFDPLFNLVNNLSPLKLFIVVARQIKVPLFSSNY